MTNEYQEIKSIVDAGYRLVVYPYCFLIVSGVGKIHILRQQDNPGDGYRFFQQYCWDGLIQDTH